MKLLADVGLVGLPNAGKSTLIRQISAAKPKVADYPFTTLHPMLGVVSVRPEESFVVADIPGLIAGAAEGAGLGMQFLRHIERTRILLHLVDISGFDPARDPVTDFDTILTELRNYSIDLSQRERWLVLNKTDCLTTEVGEMQREFVAAVDWQGPVFAISGATGAGCKELCSAIQARLVDAGEDA